MNTNKRLKRVLSYLLIFALVITMVPAMAFGAADDKVLNYPAEDQFKYTQLLSADGTRTPITKSLRLGNGDQNNQAFRAVNMYAAEESVAMLLEFNLQYTQNADIVLYRAIDMGGDVANPLTIEYSNPGEYLGERIGYIKGAQIDINVDKSDPSNVKYKEYTKDELQTEIDNLLKDKTDPAWKGMSEQTFYGYKGEPLPPNLQGFSLNLDAQADNMVATENIETESEPSSAPLGGIEEDEVTTDGNITLTENTETEGESSSAPQEGIEEDEASTEDTTDQDTLSSASSSSEETDDAGSNEAQAESKPAATQEEEEASDLIDEKNVQTTEAAGSDLLSWQDYISAGRSLRSFQVQSAAEEYILNMVLWDGTLVDAVGSPIDYEYETDQYFIVIEPNAPNLAHIKSIVGFINKVGDFESFLSLEDYSELPLICLEDPVNLLNGSFRWDYTDLSLNGRTNLAFSRHYESRYAENDYGLGNGWTSNFTYKATLEDLFAKVIMPSGDTLYFTLGFDGAYESSAGSSFIFEKLESGYRLMHQDGTVYRFNDSGDITSIKGIDDESYQFSYSGDKLKSISNDAGAFTFAWTGDHITAITDSSGRSIIYTYQGDNLATSVNPDNDSLVYAYSDNGCIEKITNFNGKVYVENEYDEFNRVVSQYVAEQGTSVFTYDPENRTNSVTGENGFFTSITYDVYGRIIEYTDNYGTQGFEYNELHQRTADIDKNGNRTEYEHDQNLNVSEIRHPDGSIEEFEYNAQNLLTSYTDGAGGVTKYTYDSKGNMTEMTDPNQNTKTYVYDASNNLMSITDALSNTTEFTYDGSGNCLTVTDAKGQVAEFTYDTIGRVKSEKKPDGALSEYEYTTAGKLVKVTDADGNIKEYEVDGNGFNTSESDFAGKNVKTEYNTMNQAISITDRMGGKTTYSYDLSGNMISETGALGFTVHYSYDSQGRLIGTTDARGGSHAFGYDANDQLIKTTDALSASSSIAYDSMGRVSVDTSKRGAQTRYSYDGAGRVVAVTDHYGNSVRYSYDAVIIGLN